MTKRDFDAELKAARAAEDWTAHARIWEEHRIADVEADEATLNDDLPPDNVQPSRFEVVTGTAPSHWASYFINGDDSGMDESEIEQADAFAEWLGGHIVDCEDAGFMHHHDASHFGVGGSDCQTYTALIDRESVQ